MSLPIGRAPYRILTLPLPPRFQWLSAPPYTLQSTVNLLAGLGYDCYMITDTHLVPLYGEWWDPRYEIWSWSNAVCFQRCSEVERVVVGGHNRVLQFLPRTDC